MRADDAPHPEIQVEHLLLVTLECDRFGLGRAVA